jgi:hypothetical protein
VEHKHAFLTSLGLLLAASGWTVFVTQGQHTWIVGATWLGPALFAASAIMFFLALRNWIPFQRHFWNILLKLRGVLCKVIPPPSSTKSRQEVVPETLASAFEPILKYENIEGQGYFLIAGQTHHLQLMNVKNAQCSVDRTANNTVARIEYVHASGDHFVIQRGAWMVDGRKGPELVQAVCLGSNAIGKLVFLAQAQDDSTWSTLGIDKVFQTGRWKVVVSITADNCQPLDGEIDFVLLPDNRLVYDTPAFHHAARASQ